MAGPAASSVWRNVWLLTITSFVADVSGEMLQAVLPFILVAQGATGIGLGLVGGISEGVGHFFKLAGGYLGGRVRRKRLLVGSGYLLAAFSRFGIAYATAWQASLAFRSLDRVGKGLRTAPRDALLADLIPRAQRGKAFGLHRAGDTAGAVVGILLALGALWAFGEEIAVDPALVLFAATVGTFAVIPLFLVREPGEADPVASGAMEPTSGRYRSFLAVSGLFYLGHLTDLFFILRAAGQDGDLSPTAAVLWYLGFNVVYMAASYPIGVLSDRVGKVPILAAGFALAALSAIAFMANPSPLTLGAGFLALGLSYAATEGTGRALAADLAGAAGRSLRLGWYHTHVGVATVVGGIAAGVLWDGFGQWAAFLWSLVLSALALVALGLWARGGADGAPRGKAT